MLNSPFPGMDPFLEEPARWRSVHTRLINAISDQLAGVLSPHFYVEIEERVTVNDFGERRQWSIYPDLIVVEKPRFGIDAPPTARTITPPLLIEPIYEPERREKFIEVRTTDSHELVTTIELLSPVNKASGTEASGAFLRKRQTVMTSPVHWIEIDLLRAGERPLEVAERSDYYALLKRGNTNSRYEVWHFNLRERMPTIAVPLRPPFDDAPLDLQEVLDDMYHRAHYAEHIDYSVMPPPPALRPADAKWLQTQVQSWQSSQINNSR